MKPCSRHSDLTALLQSDPCPVCATSRLTEISNAAFETLQSTVDALRAELDMEHESNSRLIAALSRASETIARMNREMISFRMLDESTSLQ